MYFFTSINKIAASVPPWANVVQMADGTKGYFVDTNYGHPVFLRTDGVIWLPRTLRGRKVEDLTPEELKAVDKDDQGKKHYQEWQKSYQKEAIADKLHNGYKFTNRGNSLIERLFKLVDKYELDNVGNVGISPKYSINPGLFDKLKTVNNRDDVKRLLRLIGKKFTIVIHLLAQANPKLATRLDKDFIFAYKELEVLSEFDPVGYKPLIPDQEEPTNLKHVFEDAIIKVLQEAEPLLTQNTTCVKVLSGLKKMLKLVQKAEVIDEEFIHNIELVYVETIHNLVRLMNASTLEPQFRNVSQIAEQVAQLPSIPKLHDLIFSSDSTQPQFDNSPQM